MSYDYVTVAGLTLKPDAKDDILIRLVIAY